MVTDLKAQFINEFQQLDDYLKSQFDLFEPELQPYLPDLLRLHGKKLRATLIFLTARPKPANEFSIIKAASIIEFIHYATLVHDDVLDAALLRQNHPTLNQKHGSTVAILLGDVLFAHALRLASEYPTTQVCQIVSLATRQVCTGEISQTFHREGEYIPLKEYYRIIELKTAALFSAATQLGAFLAEYDQVTIEAAKIFGRLLGIAYQIYDDALDYFGQATQAGKTLGTDFISGKWTLPLILLKDKLSFNDQSKLENMLQNPHIHQKYVLDQLKIYHIFDDLKVVFYDILQEAREALSPFEKFIKNTQFLSLLTYLESLWEATLVP